MGTERDAVLALFDRRLRRGVRTDGSGRASGPSGPDGNAVRRTGPGESWQGVVWSDLDETSADAAIAEQVRHFTALGCEFEWKLYAHDRPGDLGGRLRAAGFVPGPEETLMAAPVHPLQAGPELPEGVRLRPVTDAAGLDLVVDVHEQAFGTSGARLRRQLRAQLAREPETFSATVALADGVPVSAARMELYPGTEFAGLWGGGTVAAWRGRGLYRALIAHRARLAAARGHRYLQVDASDRSRPILRRLGFVPLSTTTPYVYRPRTAGPAGAVRTAPAGGGE